MLHLGQYFPIERLPKVVFAVAAQRVLVKLHDEVRMVQHELLKRRHADVAEELALPQVVHQAHHLAGKSA